MVVLSSLLDSYSLLTTCRDKFRGNDKRDRNDIVSLDSCWSLPLWIPACAGMTIGSGNDICLFSGFPLARE
ncbi:MAG: hypothetical protein COS84_06955 [Armatimonadetes bacterium CG07_land_8_20_14_0_80_40_9]|nr:MAG: hypothetical protein COS84_06955 [Armatimonadetes bacterium CG07_land_8_20_14_0_80_40_9]